MNENPIETQLKKYEESLSKGINNKVANEVVDIFKYVDKDLTPILNIIRYLLENIHNDKVRAVAIKNLLDFYNLGDSKNILKIRQKIDVVQGKMIKKPFLKQKDKENINTLIKDLGIL